MSFKFVCCYFSFRKNNCFLIGKKKKRNEKLCTECPHINEPHYAKGMCSNCYHSKGRSKKPWNCSHTNKTHYALGLCQNCYQMNYIKKQSECDNKKFISSVNQKNLLDLNTITTRHWMIMPCCGLTGNGLENGLNWIMDDISSRIFMLD